MFFPPFRIFKSSKKILTLLDNQHRTLNQIKQIHAQLITSRTILDPFAAAKLITISTKFDLGYSHLIFHNLPFPPSTFIYNAIIKSHTERNEPIPALLFYKHVSSLNLSKPNNYTFSFLITSCIKSSSFFNGVQVHAHILRFGWESYDFVQNGLVHMYVTLGYVDHGRKLFDQSATKDVITWTAMVTGYAKIRDIQKARDLFDSMPEKNAVSYSTIITTFSQIGLFEEALEVFNQMQCAGISPNHAGIVGCLSACAFLGAIHQGRWLHLYINRNKLELDTVLGTALIDMYAKCGCIENAMEVFGEMSTKDVFAYTSMISGLSNSDKCRKAIELFGRMEEEGVVPNEVTFIAVLSACGRMGLIDEGCKLFRKMEMVYRIKAKVEHYGCLVDMLGRAGLVREANEVAMEVMKMDPDKYVLGALLNACRDKGEVEMGKSVVRRMEEVGLDRLSGVHVLMSNMYASGGKWENVMMVRRGMEEKNVKKVPGCSMVEVDGVAWEFVAGDRSHLMLGEIEIILKGMNDQLKFCDDDDDDDVLCSFLL